MTDTKYTEIMKQCTKKVWYDTETDEYIAHCDPLNTTSQGDTEIKALSNLYEAINILLETWEEQNMLSLEMKTCGINIYET